MPSLNLLNLKLSLILFLLITSSVDNLISIPAPLQDEVVSKSRTRYYVNSQQHRVKNRIWQTLLVLFPRFDQV